MPLNWKLKTICYSGVLKLGSSNLVLKLILKPQKTEKLNFRIILTGPISHISNILFFCLIFAQKNNFDFVLTWGKKYQ